MTLAPNQPDGFLAVPPTGQGPGVLVLHAWWGLNDTIKAFCTRLAQFGFVAFAPDLYHSVVLFYGTDGTVGGDYGSSRAAYLGHFAELDQYEPPSNVDHLEETLKRAGRPVTFYRYPGAGHWFFGPDRPEAYNPAAASLAWERTLAFLR